MLVVSIELRSGLTGERSEIGRMHVINMFKSGDVCTYHAEVYKGRCGADFERKRFERIGAVENYPARKDGVWHLIGAALKDMGYVK